MDQAMVLRYIDSKGMPPTPENIMRVQNFFASNPDQLDRVAMGVPGSGTDDNSGALKLMMDDFAAKTASPTQQAPAPAAVSAGQPPIPQRGGPVRNAAPVQTQGQGYGPGAAMNLGPLPARNAPVAPTSGYEVDPQTSSTPPSGNDWLLPAILALFGATSTRGRAAMAPGAEQGGLPATQGPRGVAAAASDVVSGKPPIVPIPEVGDATGKTRLTAPNAQLEAPVPQQGQVGSDRTGQQNLPPYDNKRRTQDEFDSQNAEIDKAQSDMARERKNQLAKERAGKAARAIKK